LSCTLPRVEDGLPVSRNYNQTIYQNIMKIRTIIYIAALMLSAPSLFANITLPGIFSDHMVLQQDAVVTVWGWGKPGEMVKITVSWDPERVYKCRVMNHSFWTIDIETPAAGGPHQLKIEGYNTISISDILTGEVWLGSGQSNMEWTPSSGINNGQQEIEMSTHHEIRFYTVHTISASTPQQLVKGEWVVCSPETMKNFSALLYFFGLELQRELDLPVGLISSAWGGTPIEIWTPESIIAVDSLLDRQARLLKPVPWGPVEPGKAYNAMIHPLVPFRIRGALWYQGEANVDHPEHYAYALKTLVESWRSAWGYDFPFYYVQIAPWSGYGTDNVNGAILRDQQRIALEMTHGTGMVVISDIGDLKNIHPGNKQDAGKRLAAWALHQDYGFSDRVFSGPLYSSYDRDGEKLTLHFRYAEGGLSSGGEVLREFEIMDESGAWLGAEALIAGSDVVVESPVDEPGGIRFAYRNNSEPNLFNNAGLPASCFEILFH
jgi:sialate O-acetylesterase